MADTPPDRRRHVGQERPARPREPLEPAASGPGRAGAPGSGAPSGPGGAPPSAAPDPRHLTLSPIQVAASALASVTAAALASYFKVAGTLVGTALMSVIATCGAAIYSVSIHRTRARLGRVRNGQTRAVSGSDGPAHRHAAKDRPIGATAERRRGPAASRPANAEATRPINAATGKPKKRRRWLPRRLPLALSVAAAFVVAIGTVTVVEAATRQNLSHTVWDRSVSGLTITGGNSKPVHHTTPTGGTSKPVHHTTPTQNKKETTTTSSTTTTTSASSTTTSSSTTSTTSTTTTTTLPGDTSSTSSSTSTTAGTTSRSTTQPASP